MNTTSSSAVSLQIKEIIARLTRVGVEQIDGARTAAAHGLDSMGQLELRELLERRFRFYVDDRTFDGFGSINELIAAIEAWEAAASPSAPESFAGTLDPPQAVDGAAHHGNPRLTPAGDFFDDVDIGLSLTGLNNLAESPLLKYLGDLRWKHLSALTGVPSKDFVDDHGQRLFPVFFYVEMVFPEGRPMAAYGENDRLTIASTLKRFGNSMLDGFCYLLPPGYPSQNEIPFAGIAEALAAGVPVARLFNIFVKQQDGSGCLRTARPANPGFKLIPELAHAPESYVVMKRAERGEPLALPGDAYVSMTDAPLSVEYQLVSDRDFSSTGLVYFANYPVFLDICERAGLASARLALPEEMLDKRTLVRRQSVYLNNAAPGDALVVEIEPWIENPFAAGHPAPETAALRLFINYRMRRKSDGQVMMVATAEKIISGVPFAEAPFFSELLVEHRAK